MSPTALSVQHLLLDGDAFRPDVSGEARVALTQDCPECNGQGEVVTRWTRQTWEEPSSPAETARCSDCNGTGTVPLLCDASAHGPAVEIIGDLPHCRACAIEAHADESPSSFAAESAAQAVA